MINGHQCFNNNTRVMRCKNFFNNFEIILRNNFIFVFLSTEKKWPAAGAKLFW